MSLDRFPRGMLQPESGFHFAVDSLLLSVFITPKFRNRVLDIGCGCGVVGLSLLLAHPKKEVQLLGMDNDREMIECALKNSQRLGLDQTTRFVRMDAGEIDSSVIHAESFDLALINPPYRRPGSGRTPASPGRKAATFAPESGLDIFLKAAGFALKNKGKAGIVFPASRLDELLYALASNRLRPKKVLPVQGRSGRAANLVLVQAVKNAGQEMLLAPPLILYDAQNRITRQARNFCPYLDSNPARNSGSSWTDNIRTGT